MLFLNGICQFTKKSLRSFKIQQFQDRDSHIVIRHTFYLPKFFSLIQKEQKNARKMNMNARAKAPVVAFI